MSGIKRHSVLISSFKKTGHLGFKEMCKGLEIMEKLLSAVILACNFCVNWTRKTFRKWTLIGGAIKHFEPWTAAYFYSFFLLLSLRLKDTDTREDTATVGRHVWWGRGATRWPLPSSSCSFLHSLVSSSLTSWGGPSVCPSSSLISRAFWWAFSTAAAQARCLRFRHTSSTYGGIWLWESFG